MAEKSHLGKTRSEWLILQSRGGGFGEPSDAEIRKAVLWFEEDDRREEDQRFQTQLDDSRRGQRQTVFWARIAAGLAALAVGVDIWLHFHPIDAAPASRSIQPAATLPLPAPKP